MRQAYEKEVHSHQIGRQMAREMEKLEEYQDPNDSDYVETSQSLNLSVRGPSERQRYPT